MDKNTLSNYGWVVVAVLVLAVMIALATPFGEYIKAGVESTTAGLFDTSEKAMNVVGMDAGNGSFGPKLVYSLSDGYTEGAFIYTGGDPITHAEYNYTNKASVTAGKKYSFSLSINQPTFYVVCTYDNEGNFISGYTLSQLSELPNSGMSENQYEKEYAYITIPEGVASIALNFHANVTGGMWIYEGDFPSNNLHSYETKISGTNNLTGKSVMAFGDSISLGQISKHESFITYIAEANNINLTGDYSGGRKADAMMASLGSLNANAYDYVIVEGFINNCSTKTTIGELTAEGTTEFDTSTFIGCLEDGIYKFKQSGSSSKLGFVLVKRGYSAENMATLQRQYWDAAISVFEKYDVPYLDLFDAEYSTVDNVHADFEGNLKLAELVEAWMNTL